MIDLLDSTDPFADERLIQERVGVCLKDAGWPYVRRDYPRSATTPDTRDYRERYGYGVTTGAPARPDVAVASGQEVDPTAGMSQQSRTQFLAAVARCDESARADLVRGRQEYMSRLPAELTSMIETYLVTEGGEWTEAMFEWRECMIEAGYESYGWDDPRAPRDFFSSELESTIDAGAAPAQTQELERLVAVADFDCARDSIVAHRQDLLDRILTYVEDHQIEHPDRTLLGE